MKVKVFDSNTIIGGSIIKFEESIQAWLNDEGKNATIISTTQSGDHARTVVIIIYHK